MVEGIKKQPLVIMSVTTTVYWWKRLVFRCFLKPGRDSKLLGAGSIVKVPHMKTTVAVVPHRT